jgi:acetyl-CoA C-acetyltransferase
LQRDLDAVPSVAIAPGYQGHGVVETYTVHHQKNAPRFAVVIGRSPDGARFIARTAEDDHATVELIHRHDALGLAIAATTDGAGVTTFQPR